MKNSEFINLLRTIGKIRFDNIKYASTIGDILDITHIKIDKEFMELSKIFPNLEKDVMELIFTMITYNTKQNIIDDIKEYGRFITKVARKSKNWRFIISDITYIVENEAENLRESEFKTIFYDVDYGYTLHINGDDYKIKFNTDGLNSETRVDLLNKGQGSSYFNVIGIEQNKDGNIRVITSGERIEDEDRIRVMFEVG